MRFNEKSVVALVAGGLVVAVAAALILTRGGEEPASEVPSAAGGNAAYLLAGGPDEVLLLSGTALIRRDVESDTEEPVGEIPSPSIYPARGSTWIAYVTSKPSPDDDFAAEPVLHLYDPETQDKSRHGPGVAPVWNATGTHVAFLRPIEPRNCQGETCTGGVQIGVVEAATGTEIQLLDPGNYSILGWGGDWIFVSDFEDPTRVISVSLDDERGVLEMPASQYWAASPDGRWVVKTNAKKTELVGVEDGELTKERIPVELGDRQLLEGAWAHDSSRAAAVTSVSPPASRRRAGDDGAAGRQPATEVVLFSPDDPKPAPVDGTSGATGTVLWSVDNEAIVFATLIDPRRALFQAKHCPVGNSAACKIVTSWTEGVALLRTE